MYLYKNKFAQSSRYNFDLLKKYTEIWWSSKNDLRYIHIYISLFSAEYLLLKSMILRNVHDLRMENL